MYQRHTARQPDKVKSLSHAGELCPRFQTTGDQCPQWAWEYWWETWWNQIASERYYMWPETLCMRFFSENRLWCMVDKPYHRANLRSSLRPIAHFAVDLQCFVCNCATPLTIEKLLSKGVAITDVSRGKLVLRVVLRKNSRWAWPGIATISTFITTHGLSLAICGMLTIKDWGLALGSEWEVHYIYILNPSVQRKLNCAGIWRVHAAGPAKKPREGLFAKFIRHQSGSSNSNHCKRYPRRNSWRTSRNLQGKLPIFFWPKSGPQKNA